MTGAAAAFVGGSATIAVTLSPTSVSGYSDPGATANISSGSVVVTASGGVSPYSYAWAQVGTAPYTWTISAPTAANTYFTGQSIPEGVATSANFHVVVTDAAGNSGTASITATVRNKIQNFDTGKL